MNIGNALFHQEYFNEALFCYNKALEIEPKNLIFSKNKGNVIS